MEGKRYWSREELIEYFKNLAFHFEREGVRASNDKYRSYVWGKQEAYAQVAFELEHNMED